MSSSSDSSGKDPLASLRHDLRTPINQIIGYSELVGEELVDLGEQGLQQDLEKVAKAARTLLDLIQKELQPDRYQFIGSHTLPPQSAPQPSSPATGKPQANIRSPRIHTEEENSEDSTVNRENLTGTVLVVDDHEENRNMLSRRLEKHGLSVHTAESGEQALEIVQTVPLDVILLDIMMPGMDGREVLRHLKENERTRHIPVIMISALDELESVIYCIENGAEDFLPKPFNPTFLRARIGASLEKKYFRDQEQRYLHALQETQATLQNELNEAADYVSSLLPPEENSPISIRWKFVPSTSLGGDSFGYHWIDDDHFAVYLVDVCGHGVGAALLSISAINVLRSQTLPNTDFRSPSAVLESLNTTFPMERQNNMYFTIWYGIFHKPTRTLRYSSGGHPPALLYDPASQTLEQLRTPGLVIGCMEGAIYQEKSVSVPQNARLLVFSDGVYEITREDGSLVTLEEFADSLKAGLSRTESVVGEAFAHAQQLQRAEILDDDFSLVDIRFDVD